MSIEPNLQIKQDKMNGNEMAIDVLLKKREQLVIEKQKMTERFDGEIIQMEKSIELLSGKKVWDFGLINTYDDENPDYIRQSIEEL